jgi:PAT family beta-lactamase induction signal transducer AmpG
MTQKRFSATQYALFSSLFGLPRIVSGPLCGFLVYAIGWEAFFWATLFFGIPGMVMLARFVPWGAREPEFSIEPPRIREPLTGTGLTFRGLTGGVIGVGLGALIVALMNALKPFKDNPGSAFDVLTPLVALVQPVKTTDWVTLVGLVVFGVTCGLLTAAVVAARHGAGQGIAEDMTPEV